MSDLYAFGMNSTELSLLSLHHNYLICDCCGSGKGRIHVEEQCAKLMALVETAVNSSPVVIFIVSLMVESKKAA